MLSFKLIDGVIKEPLGGAHTDMKKASGELEKTVLKHLKQLQNLSPQKRIEQRIKKFSEMGVYGQ